MGRVARRLRWECLRNSVGLDNWGASPKQRLAALVTEIMQDKVAGEEIKSEETLENENMYIETIIKRIRC